MTKQVQQWKAPQYYLAICIYIRVSFAPLHSNIHDYCCRSHGAVFGNLFTTHGKPKITFFRVRVLIFFSIFTTNETIGEIVLQDVLIVL